MKKLFYIVGKKYTGKTEIYRRIICDGVIKPFKYAKVTDDVGQELSE